VSMIATLYYEPLWIFGRANERVAQINELKGKRIATGEPGSGTRALVRQMLSVNGIGDGGSAVLEVGTIEGLRLLESGEVDVAMLVGGADTPLILQALRNPRLSLVSMVRADAYVRRFTYVSKLVLPAGTLDLANGVPEREITLIGTKAMLVARDDLHPALTALFIEAAREVHGGQGPFEAAGEFPSLAPVDLPVSPEAAQFTRHGPTFLSRYLPFWAANFVERALTLVLPLAVVIYPLLHFVPQVLRWRFRSRVFRWYGELAMLEHDVQTRIGALPVERWMADLDRIEQATERIFIPPSIASDAYTLREHVAVVRNAVLAKVRKTDADPGFRTG
jgi:hypothetical protein